MKRVLEKVLNGRKLFTPDDVGQHMGQLVMNSDEYANLTAAERSQISDAVIQAGTQLGQALRARQSLTDALMTSPEAVKSTLRVINDRTDNPDSTREKVKKETGIDPLNPPDGLMDDKDKLDQVLRELKACGACVCHYQNCFPRLAKTVSHCIFRHFSKRGGTAVFEKKHRRTILLQQHSMERK